VNFNAWRREIHLCIWLRKPSVQQTFYRYTQISSSPQ